MIERPLTLKELCDFLQVGRSTIYQYNHEGLPRFYAGKHCLYIPAKVIEWLERRSQHRVLDPEQTFDPRKELSR